MWSLACEFKTGSMFFYVGRYSYKGLDVAVSCANSARGVRASGTDGVPWSALITRSMGNSSDFRPNAGPHVMGRGVFGAPSSALHNQRLLLLTIRPKPRRSKKPHKRRNGPRSLPSDKFGLRKSHRNNPAWFACVDNSYGDFVVADSTNRCMVLEVNLLTDHKTSMQKSEYIPFKTT